MKYFETGGFQSNTLMRLTLGGCLIFLTGLWLTSFGLYFSRFGLTPASVVAYFRGSEETFQPPRTFGSMVEVSHGHFAMMALVLLLLTHLCIFVPFSRRLKTVAIVGTFSAAFLNELSGWLVRYVHPAFAPLKPIAFLASQGFQAALLLTLAMFVFRGASRPAAEASDPAAAWPPEDARGSLG